MSTAVVEDFCITSDKLDEWKEVLPKAGPKFRLGKYFDTIYEIPEFDAIKEPEGGYLSCWDNETDIEDDSGNFLFANIDGDSASVICLNDDEAIDLIQRWKAKEVSHNKTKGNPKIHQEELSSKPGSDGTYEIVDGDEVTTTNDEHIYESIEDCTPEYQLFIGNENASPVHTPTHATTVLQRQVSRKSTISKSKRSNSMPVSSISSPKFARKYSDCTEYSRLKRRQNLSMDGSSTNASNRPLPGLPPPLPPPNGSVYTTTSSDYSQLYGRLNEKLSPDKEDTSPPPSMILKHKGKSYVLPITESSSSGGKPSNRDKAAKRQSSIGCSTTPKHIPNSPMHSSTEHRYNVPRSVSMGFQCTPKNQSNVDTTPRRKSKHSSSRSTPHHTSAAPAGPAALSQPNKSQVTLYGVL